MPTGFVERIKGKITQSKDCSQQMGTGGALFKGGGTIYVNSSSAGLGNTSDTNADTLDSYSLPANSLYGNQYMLTIGAFGLFAANTNAKTASLSFGSETVTATSSASAAGGTPWSLQLQVFKIASNTQFVTSQQIVSTTHGGITEQVVATETDTTAIPIVVKGRTAVATANDVALYAWFVEANNF